MLEYKKLYIYKYLNNIIDSLLNNDVIIVQAPTGTGKSLGIPKAIVETFNYRIFISVPTIAAVINLYKQQQILSPNIEIGYAAEGDIYYNDKTRIIYCTTGHLRKVMLGHNNKNLDFCDVIMVDEAHTGIVDNSIVLSLYKHFMKNGQTINNKLIITSATIDNLLFDNAEKIKIDIKSKIIKEKYHNVDFLSNNNDLYIETAKVIMEFHKTEPDGKHFLIFAPGRNEIQIIINNLMINDAEILELTGQMDYDLLDKVFLPCPENKKRKIIIATNAAESSITVEDISVVIDTMEEKVAGSTPSGSISLTLSDISKSSAIQRKGRTGRTINGTCYRMCTENFYNKLKETRENDILRIPLHTYILEFLKHGFDPVDILYELKNSNKIKETMILIKQLKLYNEEKSIVTDMGNFIADFPLSVRCGYILYKSITDINYINNIENLSKNTSLSIKQKINIANLNISIYSIIVSLSIIDCFGPSYFYIPKFKNDDPTVNISKLIEEYTLDHFFEYIESSDLETHLNWFNKLMKDYIEEHQQIFKFNKTWIRNWCVKNSFNNKKVSELLKRIDKIIQMLNKKHYTIIPERFNIKDLITKLKIHIDEAYKDRIMININNKYTPTNVNELHYINKRISYTLNPLSNKCIIGLICSIIKNKNIVRFVDFYIPYLN